MPYGSDLNPFVLWYSKGRFQVDTAYNRALPLMLSGPSTQITYIIPMEVGMSERSYSPFSGFSQEFIDKSYFLSIISQLPQDICELSSPSYLNLAARKEIGDYKIFVLNFDVLSQLPSQALTPYICIFSSRSTHSQCVRLLDSFPIRAIHVSDLNKDGAILPHELTRKRMRKEFSSISKIYAHHLDEEDRRILKRLISGRPKTYRSSKLKLKHRIHNIVKPSECALVSHRYKFGKSLHLGSGGKNSYVKGIVDISKVMLRIRGLIPIRYHRDKNDFVLGLPSFYAYLYKDKHIRDVLDNFGGKFTKNFFEKYILRYRGYVPTNVKVNNISSVVENPHIAFVTQVRQQELFAFTNLMSILSSEDFSPFIRLPNDLNLMHGMLDNVESLVRGSAKGRTEKLNREFSKVSNFILGAIPHEVLGVISDCGEKGVIVSDYPIEWMCLDNDVPLLFTRELCRIGSTPGNILSELVCNTERAEFDISYVNQVLILRSFKDDDPIRNYLEVAVRHFSDEFSNGTEVLFVDVDSEEELYRALNTYCPFFAVFDCHGNHGGRKEHAWLQIGDDKVDVWKLRGRCHVPIIAALSACSTHPVAGSHASVANGLLASGVAGVIATSVPIPAVDAASFIARLIYRIDTYLPLQLKMFTRKVCWREFVTKMLRMSYSTDILRAYREAKPAWISEEQYMSIHRDMNIDINIGDQHWHYVLFDRIAESSGRTIEDVKNFFIRNVRFIHSAFYVQIGRPDKVFIVRDAK